MADRVSASITIGGTLPRSLLPDLAALIAAEDLSTEWDGEPFTPAQLPEGAPLELMAHEVGWGRFEALERWCVEQGLAFTRWSGAYPGQWGAERAVFTGAGGFWQSIRRCGCTSALLHPVLRGGNASAAWSSSCLASPRRSRLLGRMTWDGRELSKPSPCGLFPRPRPPHAAHRVGTPSLRSPRGRCAFK